MCTPRAYMVDIQRMVDTYPPTSARLVDTYPPTSARLVDTLPPTSARLVDTLPPTCRLCCHLHVGPAHRARLGAATASHRCFFCFCASTPHRVTSMWALRMALVSAACRCPASRAASSSRATSSCRRASEARGTMKRYGHEKQLKIFSFHGPAPPRPAGERARRVAERGTGPEGPSAGRRQSQRVCGEAGGEAGRRPLGRGGGSRAR